LQIAIPLGLGIFLIWYIYQKFTPEQLDLVFMHFENADYWIVALSVVFSLISHIIRAYRWNFMLEPLGFQPKIANNFMAVSVAYLMNIFIPKSGEVSRALVLTKYEGVPFDKGFGTIITERVVDLILLLAFTMIALFLQFEVLYTYITEQVPVAKIGLVLALLIALAIGFFAFLKYSKSAFATKLNGFIAGLKDGLFSIARMKKKAAFIVYSLLIWALYILSFYTATYALEETAAISMGTVIITFVVGSFTFAFTNSGFGSYPAAIMGILLVFGIAEEVGFAFGWIVWTSNIAALLFFGVTSLFLLPIYNRPKVEQLS
jgi:uncharacterized protein (TIRG00374 family)